MTQPEDTLERRITGHLDRGADQIDAATRERLLAARERALLTYRATVPVPGFAWAGHAVSRVTGHRFHSLRNAVALAVVLLALTGLAIWISAGPANELAEIDAGLLTDELPINAYLDKGFDSWLKRGSR
ncbi:MAG TPA: DUF3619 family protein [Burkholderiales bacterium]|jgi:hypothetical protein|nr:DUF3619 family protein [Burkholderiales bacterium]